MNPFPGRNSVIVMDNATVHHGGRIGEICDAANVLLIYLPPYSPDHNPIEKVFSVVKSQLKRNRMLTGGEEDPDLIEAHLERMVTTRLMRNLFIGSGYSV
jgi:transposase